MDFAPSMSSSTQHRVPKGFPGASEDAPLTAPQSTSGQQCDNPVSSDRPLRKKETDGKVADEDGDDIGEPPEDVRVFGSTGQPPLEDRVGPSHLCPSPSKFEQLHALAARGFADSASEDDMECIDDVVVLRKMLVRLKKQRNRARSERDAAATYTILARQSIHHMQAELNATQKRSKSRRNINVGGRIVTSDEGRALAAQQRQARIEKQSNAEQTRRKKNHADFGRLGHRHEKGRDVMTFTGAINTQKHSNLADIAWCTDIDDSGTRNTLITRISAAHVDANEQLREDPRFTGLWRRSFTCAAPDGSPDTKRQRIDDAGNTQLHSYGATPSADVTSAP